MKIEVDLSVEQMLMEISPKRALKHYGEKTLLEHMDVVTVLNYGIHLFEAIDAHVKGGSDPAFNQAYNQWRYDK